MSNRHLGFYFQVSEISGEVVAVTSPGHRGSLFVGCWVGRHVSRVNGAGMPVWLLQDEKDRRDKGRVRYR